MKKIPFILTLLTANAALGQVGYRSVQNDQPVKKTYDSTVNFERIKCQFDPASMIGQEVYFAQRSPYFKGYSSSDTLLKVFISDKKTPVNDILDEATREHLKNGNPFNYGDPSIDKRKLHGGIKWSDNLQSNLYKPAFEKYGPYSGAAGTPYSALENKTFTVTGWEILKEDEDYCPIKVTLKDPGGEQVEWSLLTRYLPNVSVFTKGYLEKLKQTWVNKTVYFRTENYDPRDFYNPLDKKTYDYAQGSKWQCTELTFLFDEGYFGRLHLILRNEAKKEIAVQVDPRGDLDKQLSLNYIWPEEEYLAVKQKEKHEQDSLLAKEKADKRQLDKDLKVQRQQLIKQYGATYGNLIADGQVKMGMTRNMCDAAWGTPDKIVKTQVGGNVIETWFYYTSSSWLKFRDGKLTQIME